MELSTTIGDRALHLAIYVIAAIALGIVALAMLERLVDSGRKVIGARHMLIALGAVAVSIIGERLYHALS